MAANNDNGTLRLRSGSLVDGLARKVISEVNNGSLRGRDQRLEEGTKLLLSAVLAPAPFDTERVCRDLDTLRISRAEIVDHCVHQVASELGVGWLGDTLTFASVSTASARIYGLCKDLDGGWASRSTDANSKSVLLATVGREDHMIGPTVLADQLRRRNHSVAVMLNTDGDLLRRKLAHASHDVIMISVGSYQTLDLSAKVITQIRNEGVDAPIVLGGAILDFEIGLDEITGADLVTKSVDTALAGLSTSSKATQGV